ncbi:hypothetical protein PF010_g365 [Phytophthora fragariae]|uniref:Enoyl reductase (ER) domain-containing protein n=2 Tax=Phytophthora fragariae TaxID=53985 RepID=A0A6A3UZB9_9STRA|nr:hypothetical protein PF009_g374 [Phytophthora fragariae]KAE9139435.1 hypothetical protein PF007_g1024 [Phytophthora fragariae]KAE9139980.1 hypothetical protein PF010_g365 [Phytophthora fragariae]KAE9155850.1 hypothetical protein PF006_g260 [Phytophthora fragariae]KAE9252218.1 hypothetical protein PF004_g2078 [Phytophthora fragariae]
MAATVPATFKAYESQPNEVKIKVLSASLNPIDYKIGLYASMILSTMASPENPYRVGHDLAGKVVEVGSDVKDYQIGQRVLFLGGSSGTGLFAIQIAKALDAEVVATCRHRNVELVKSLGADEVTDNTSDKWSDVLAEHSIHLVYDCGVESQSWNDAAQKIFNAPCTEYLLELKKLIEAGQAKTVINSVHPLENLVEAMKICMSHRAKGKIVIEVAKE